MTVDPLAVAAARNNAALCDAVCRAHGIVGRFDTDAWTSERRTPPLYPDAVTLAPDADLDEVLARIDTSSGCTVKDSFATLGNTHGLRVLFDGAWIAKEPDAAQEGRLALTWRVVLKPNDLAAWERAWRGEDGPVGLFPPGALDEDLVFLAGFADRALVAGAIANPTDDVVGISNVFARTGPVSHIWPGCLTAVSEHFPDRPVVGYESGGELDAAVRQGFRTVGPLRVWVRENR
jgi:hypothetical protein